MNGISIVADEHTNTENGDACKRADLSSLPRELHLHILEYLTWPAIKSLRSSNAYFANLITSLADRHRTCADFVYDKEQKARKQIEAEFWQQAEEAFRGYHTSSYTSSSLDPDLRAHLQRKSCMTSALPCYRCLEWKPSHTSEQRFGTESCFTRGRSTLSFDLGSSKARQRVCIECGIKTGLYVRGNRVKHSAICRLCGVVEAPPGTWSWAWSDPRLTWKVKNYCQACLKFPDVVAMTKEQFLHERRWMKYSMSMARGKEYRLRKGAKLRQEKGLPGFYDQSPVVDLDSLLPNNAKWCPILKRRIVCDCHRKAKDAPEPN